MDLAVGSGSPSAEHPRSLHHVQTALTQLPSGERSLNAWFSEMSSSRVRREVHRAGLCTRFHGEGGLQARTSPWGTRVQHPGAGRTLAHIVEVEGKELVRSQ